MSDSKLVHVIDDDAAVRDAVAMLLSAEGYTVHTYETAPAFLKSIAMRNGGCVVTDVRMPEMNGIELLARMREARLSLPVVVLTAHADVPLAVEAMKLGAIDLLEKPFDDHALLAAVDAALERRDAEENRSRETMAIKSRLATLTKRENEILAGLLRGLSNKIIAHDLGISIRTAEVHRANIMSKMRAGNLAELVKMALAADAGARTESE